jgi:MtN3 and saliva related transmembrane protein
MMTIVSITGLLAAAGTTVSFLPQAFKTIYTKNTSGISLYMYALFTAGNLLWLIYGLMIQDLPIIVANTITMILASIILVYKIIYK